MLRGSHNAEGDPQCWEAPTKMRSPHNAERQPQSVPELIFGATGATGVTGAIGGCVKFLPAVLFFSRNNTIYSVLEDNGQDYWSKQRFMLPWSESDDVVIYTFFGVRLRASQKLRFLTIIMSDPSQSFSSLKTLFLWTISWSLKNSLILVSSYLSLTIKRIRTHEQWIVITKFVRISFYVMGNIFVNVRS